MGKRRQSDEVIVDKSTTKKKKEQPKSNFGELLLGNDVACPIKIIDLEYAGEKNTQEEEEDIKDEYSLLIFFTFKCKHFMHMKLNKN